MMVVIILFNVGECFTTHDQLHISPTKEWGWANVGYHRNPPTNEVVTPNIDNLVK